MVSGRSDFGLWIERLSSFYEEKTGMRLYGLWWVATARRMQGVAKTVADVQADGPHLYRPLRRTGRIVFANLDWPLSFTAT